MAFLEDPRLRQRWNQISHNAEAVTENAAAGIWSFSHNYINPCLGTVSRSLETCTAPCFGDREERARRRRERERTRGRAEYSFDFYDDWYEDEDSGLLGAWSNEDWDRLLAGGGPPRRTFSGEVANEQPKRRRGMSYGTRGHRRKPSTDDPTVIPSTQPIGFLGKLPWKIGGTLRYKPSAADLQDHPGHHDENTPLLLGEDSGQPAQRRKRSGTAGSGDTSDSYRSRGDLFPSDGEGDEDAVPLDDEFTLPLDRTDDRSSNRTRSSKGKRPAGSRAISRTVSRTTVASQNSARSPQPRGSTESMQALKTPSMEQLQVNVQAENADKELMGKRPETTELPAEHSLSVGGTIDTEEDLKHESESIHVHEIPDGQEEPEILDPTQPNELDIASEHRDDAPHHEAPGEEERQQEERQEEEEVEEEVEQEEDYGEFITPVSNSHPKSPAPSPPDGGFVPARLPNFR